MVITNTDLSLDEIAREQNNRFDQKRYLAEERFSEFISQFDEVKPLSRYTDSIRNGQDFKTDSYSPVETEILYISVNQISSGILGRLYWDDITYLDIEEDEIEVEAEVGDILITRSGSYPGIAWRASEEYLDDYRIIPSGFVQRLRLEENAEVDSEFIAAYLNSPPVKMLTQAFACGKEQLNISQEYIKSIPVPVLDKERRQEVVTGVKSYQNQIDQMQELINRMKVKQGDAIVDILSDEDVDIPEIADLTQSEFEFSSLDSESWGLPTRRGQSESTFYVSNSG